MENRKYNTKSIVEAGLISSIIVVLMLITGYVPIISFVGTLVLPIPVTILYIRHNLKVTIVAIVVSTIITAFLFNPIQAVLSAFSFGFIGLILGYTVKKDKSSTFAILLLALSSLLATILTYIITIVIIQRTSFTAFFTNTINQMNDMIKQSVDMAKSFYASAGMTKEQLAQIDSIFSMINIENIINMFAAALVLQALISAIVNYGVAKAILKKLGYEMKKLRAFTELYISSFAGALIVLPVAIGMLLNAKKVPIGKPILISSEIIMQYIFLVIGVSVVVYYLKNKFNMSKGMIILISIVIVVTPIFTMLLIYIGLADMILDFRKINPNRILKRQ